MSGSDRKLKYRVWIVNAAILFGLLYKYATGSPLLTVVLTGILLLALANGIFFIRFPKNIVPK